jgi:ribosome maturation factor RimP
MLFSTINIEKRVIELVEEKIADRDDLFLVKVNLATTGQLSILIDGDKGVTIEDCVAVSRHVGFHLEEEGVIETTYNLEVSSPGLDTPLVLERQYVKNIGRNVSVKLLTNEKREGKLLAYNQDGILIEEMIKEKGKKAEKKESLIPFEQIKETKVLISFK